MDNRTYKGFIDTLDSHEIFVFGANTQGRHGKGTALIARQKFGAIYGQPSGLQGQSYGIITKDLTKSVHPSVSPEFICNQIMNLYTFATDNPQFDFYVAYSGKGRNLNGYQPSEMASFFVIGTPPKNMIFEEEFYDLMKTFICNQRIKG